MPHNLPTEQPLPADQRPTEEPFVGHETRDVNVRGILWLAAATAIGTVLVAAGLWLLIQRYQAAARRADPQLSPLFQAEEPPPPPRLQDAPIRDYQEFVREQDQHLDTYGWVDRREGVVRIPIERAMEIVATHGPPKRESSAPPADSEAAP